jgi:hypothetical protein
MRRLLLMVLGFAAFIALTGPAALRRWHLVYASLAGRNASAQHLSH